MALDKNDILALTELLDKSFKASEEKILSRIDGLENDLYTEIGNTQGYLEKKIDYMQSSIDTIKSNNTTVDLLLKLLTDLQKRVTDLESKLAS